MRRTLIIRPCAARHMRRIERGRKGMHGAFREYRFFVLDERRNVKSMTCLLCEDDAEALSLAAGQTGAEIEVWEVNRRVAVISREV
jgi:hypothetical protein